MAAGVWAAATLVRDFHINGSVSRQIPVVLVIVGVLFTATRLLPAPAYRALQRRIRRTAEHDMRASFDLDVPNDVSERKFFSALRRLWALFGALFGIQVAMGVAVGPVALHLSVRLCEALGLPVRLSGFGATVIAAWVILGLCPVLTYVLRAPTGRIPALQAVYVLVRQALVLSGLLLAARVLDGVRVTAGPEWRQLLVLAVLTVLFTLLAFEFSAPGLTLLFLVTFSALKLWLLSWLSTWMDPALQISGFWTFLGTALFIVALTWPIRVIDGRRRQAEQPPDPFWDMHHMPPQPPSTYF